MNHLARDGNGLRWVTPGLWQTQVCAVRWQHWRDVGGNAIDEVTVADLTKRLNQSSVGFCDVYYLLVIGPA